MRRLLLLISLLSVSAIARAENGRAAVFAFEDGRVAVDLAVHQQLEEVVRSASASVLHEIGYLVLAGAGVEQWAEENHVTLRPCDAECASKLAKQLKLSLYITGTLSRTGQDYVAFVRAMDAESGLALAAVQLRAATPAGLAQQFEAKAKALYTRAFPELFEESDEDSGSAASQEEWISACHRGEASGCNQAGFAYLYGDGVAIDEAKGALYYERSCKLNDAQGCAFLGWVYQNGLGGREKNEVRAAVHYERGCLNGKGSAFACTLLGELYQHGQGVRRDSVRAAQLFRQGCEASDSEGCYLLSAAYQQGQGVKQNAETAREYRRKACANGYDNACEAAQND